MTTADMLLVSVSVSIDITNINAINNLLTARSVAYFCIISAIYGNPPKPLRLEPIYRGC